jgi:SAM-dependent methyltransferase
MPLRMTLLERLLVQLNLLPTPLFDAMLAPGVEKAVLTACELGLFDALSGQPLSLSALANRVACQPEGLRLLVNILLPAGYLHRRGGLYRNSRAAQRWLTSSSPAVTTPSILHSPDLVAFWENMPVVVRDSGQAATMLYERDALPESMHELLARHYAWLASLAMVLGNEVIRRAPVSKSATHLLDVGGSHAAYSVLFCRKYPRLQATILDIKPGIETGKRATVQTSMADRLSFVSVDIVGDDFEFGIAGSFDVVVYFHIAHLLPPETSVAVLSKVARTLKQGGVLVFVDQATDQVYRSGLAALMVQLMAVTMTTLGGKSHPYSTVKGWLEQVGLGNVRSHRLITPGATMITASKT